MSWPIGMGKRFKGVYNLYRKELRLFSPGGETRHREAVVIGDLADHRLEELLGSQAIELRNDIELLEGLPAPSSWPNISRETRRRSSSAARQQLRYRGTARRPGDLAPAPGPRATQSRMVAPDEEAFSGFVFKIQANMDPMHRDRIAFLRICSGSSPAA